MKKTLNRGLVAAFFLTLAGASQAAAIDVTTVVAEIGAQAAPVAAIGAAVLALIVGIKAFQWVRRALA